MTKDSRGTFKSALKKCGSYSVSTLSIFAELNNNANRPLLKLSNMASYSAVNLKKDYFKIAFIAEDGNDKEITCEVKNQPLREVVRNRLRHFFTNHVTDFDLFVDASNTALPHNLGTCHFVAGLKILVKDIKTCERLRNDSESMEVKSGRSSILSLTTKRQDSLDFIEETEEENSPDLEVSSRLNEMVPAASEVCHVGKKSSIASPKCRRMTSIHQKLSGYKEDKIIDDETLKLMLDEKLGFLFKTIPNLSDAETPSVLEDWTQFIDKNCLRQLDRMEKSKQDAIWELISTEVSFLRKMYILLNIFVRPVRSIFLLNDFPNDDVQVQKAFTNIEDVYEANSQFWTLYLKPMYDRLKDHGQLFDIIDLRRAFSEFAVLFFPYIKYITDEHVATEYFKNTYKKNAIFRYIIENCEKRSPERLSYLDLFIQPMQRLTRYKLLLQAIMKRCSCDTEICELKAMINIVEDFVRAANSALVNKEEKNRIEDAMQRIAVYDSYLAPPELQNIIKDKYKLNCWVDLTARLPSHQMTRQIIQHGHMKMKDYKEKIEVYCYLLTDMFVILRWKKNCNRLKMYRGPIKIDKIDIMQSNEELKAHFIMIIRGDFEFVDSGYAFYTPNNNEWIKSIKQTKDEYLCSLNVCTQSIATPIMSTLSKSAPRVLYSFKPHPQTKIKRRCTTNSCKTCGIKSKEAEDRFGIDEEDDLVEHYNEHSLGSSFTEIPLPFERNNSEQLVRPLSGLSISDGSYIQNNDLHNRLPGTQLIASSFRTSSMDDLDYAMIRRYTLDCRSLGRNYQCSSASNKRAIFLNYLQREDSLMSTGSKKSSSGVSSSNSSSLLNILEDIF